MIYHAIPSHPIEFILSALAMGSYNPVWSTSYDSEGIEQALDTSKFHCRFCDKDYVIGKMRENAILQHISKGSHKSKKPDAQPKVPNLWRAEWDEKYGAEGISKAGDPSKFHCDHCKNDFALGKGTGEFTISRHINTQGHLSCLYAMDELNDAMLETEISGEKFTWNRRKLVRSQGAASDMTSWCQSVGLLNSTRDCKHRHPMTLSERSGDGLPRFRCRRDGCDESISVAVGTILEDNHLPIDKFVSLMYSYAHNDSYEAARREAMTSDGTALSHKTIAFYYSLFRELIFDNYSYFAQ